MRIFGKDEEAVSPVIGVILMVAITVILAAVIAAFVFGLGGSQTAAPTASVVAANNPDTGGADMRIQHKGGDLLKGGEWKLSIVKAGDAPVYIISEKLQDFGVGSQIITMNQTDWPTDGTIYLNVTSSRVWYTTMPASVPVPENTPPAGAVVLTSNQKYDVKLVHIPSNAMLLDQIIEVR